MKNTAVKICFALFLNTLDYQAYGEIKHINICEDGAMWPPYHYLEQKNGVKTSKAKGYGIDVLNEILGNLGITYKIDFMPWKRCLLYLENGDKYQMALSGSYNAARDKLYHLIAWYKTTPYYFYSKKHYPNGLNINKVADFKNYRTCGLRGYNYIYVAEIEDKIYKNIENYDKLIQMLHKNRYDVTFEQYEIFAGFFSLGKDYLNDKNLGYKKIPGAKPTWFNMMISKKYQHSSKLRRILNEGIAELFWSGKYKELLSKHRLIAE